MSDADDATGDEGTADGLPETPAQETCPGCETPPHRFPRTVITVDRGDGEWWHSICLLEAHPQVERQSKKACPNCGILTDYRPLTRPPEARTCPRCVTVFPDDAERFEGVLLEYPPLDDDVATEERETGGSR